jgi:hypothetical protein
VCLVGLVLSLGNGGKCEVFGLNIIYEEEVGLGSAVAGLSEKTLDLLLVDRVIGLDTEVQLLMIEVESSLEALISSGSGAPLEVKVDTCLHVGEIKTILEGLGGDDILGGCLKLGVVLQVEDLSTSVKVLGLVCELVDSVGIAELELSCHLLVIAVCFKSHNISAIVSLNGAILVLLALESVRLAERH